MKKVMVSLIAVIAMLIINSPAMSSISAGATGSVTIYSPNSEAGAAASLWGWYYSNTGGGWINHTFGTGTFDATGNATVNYTIPSDYDSNFYWNTVAGYSASRQEKGTHINPSGGWNQFETYDPAGQTVNMNVYMFDQMNLTNTTASFRASAKGATVFPNADLAGAQVTVYKPWDGTMADYSTSGTGAYYTHEKKGLAPTYAASKGYTVDVLIGDASATQQFQKIRLHNADNSYSVDLFGYKNISTTDPLGYVWWTTLETETVANCSYNAATGVFSGTFASPVDSGKVYMVNPWVYDYDSTEYTKYSSISAGSTDLLLSGTYVPEPATLAILALGGLLIRRKK